MPTLPDDVLAAITARDEAAGDGIAGQDYDCAHDRHLLLAEVTRLRDILTRVRSGRPISDIGVS